MVVSGSEIDNYSAARLRFWLFPGVSAGFSGPEHRRGTQQLDLATRPMLNTWDTTRRIGSPVSSCKPPRKHGQTPQANAMIEKKPQKTWVV